MPVLVCGRKTEKQNRKSQIIFCSPSAFLPWKLRAENMSQMGILVA
jgi:hypothetical protein